MNIDQPKSESSATDEFADAWGHVDHARSRLTTLAQTWNAACTDAYSAHLSIDPAGRGEIVADLNFDDATYDSLDQAARGFGASLREALDTSVLTLARLVSGPLVTPDEALVRFPLADTHDEFLSAYANGALDGIRPDQQQFIERLQPFNNVTPASAVLDFLRQLTAASSQRVVTVNAHSATPEVMITPPSTAVILTVEPDGPITTSKRIATFQVTHPLGSSPEDHPRVLGNPNVAFDLVAAVGSPPSNPDDTFCHRGRIVLATVTLTLEAMERSIGLREGSVDSWDPLTRLDLSLTSEAGWARLRPEQDRASEAADAVAESDIGVATVGDGHELTLVVADGEDVYLRHVAAATALDPRLPKGPAAEGAAASAAATWGLPDFVFPPVKRKTGSGTREIGDGIVLVGDKGLILQVKSRDNPGVKPEREISWVTKKAAEAAGQAAGTLRQLRLQPATLHNQRGRKIVIDGNAAGWIGVVIIDHPEPPAGITLPVLHKGLVVITLLRRDWEFLFEQLGSTAAVVAYLHRVGDEPCELGDEPARYYDLAAKDAEAEPTPAVNRWAAETGGQLSSPPLLPRIPATTAPGPGRAMFRMVLEDLADTRFDEENQRLTLMAILDQTPVAHQAEIGDRLLQMLKNARQTTPGHCTWDVRWVFDTQHPQQIGFGVFNQLSKWHTEAFRQRLLLQHHRITRHQWPSSDEPTSVGVLLTPNYYLRDRLWDTTVLAAFGPSDLQPADITAYEAFWGRGR